MHNLHDNGVDVTIGLYKGSKSWALAEEAGLKVMTAEEAAKACNVIRCWLMMKYS